MFGPNLRTRNVIFTLLYLIPHLGCIYELPFLVVIAMPSCDFTIQWGQNLVLIEFIVVILFLRQFVIPLKLFLIFYLLLSGRVCLYLE